MDVSEQCGHSVEEQVKLFNDIKPLFANKPIVLVNNKIDVRRFSELSAERQALFEDLKKEENVHIFEMSTVSEEGVIEVRNEACDLLLAHRVDNKIRGKKATGILNRLHVALPQPRDQKERPPCIPEAVLMKRQRMGEMQERRKLERDLEVELGDDYILDLKKRYDLEEDDDKYDVIPELWEGHNIADFVDPDIEQKLKELEAEEDKLDEDGYYDLPESGTDEEMDLIRSQAKQIRHTKALLKNEAKMKKNTTKPKLPRTARKRERSVSRLRSEMGRVGVELDSDDEAHYDEAAAEVVRSRPLKRKREDSEGRVRSSSKVPRDESGIRDVKTRKKAVAISKKAQTGRNRDARKGEGDRHIFDVKPKHLYVGKRGMGKNDRR
jgi:nucleolar GTP-binding protein